MEKKILSHDLIEALSGERTPKFLATLSETGVPNIVPVVSLRPADERTIVFGEFMVVKTKRNLERVPEVGIAVFTEDLKVWTLRGRFLRFEKSGGYVDLINSTAMFRYNAYSGVRSAGVIEALEVTRTRAMTTLELLREMLMVKVLQRILRQAGNNGVSLPPVVREKFDRLKAVKFLAYRDDEGFPACIPVPSLFTSAKGKMIFGASADRRILQHVPQGTVMAASVITLDPVAYQIKGSFEGMRSSRAGSVGFMRIQEAYSASPPLPGHRIV